MTRLAGTATLGPLCYFSGRLVWVQDASRAVVSDLAGRYTAELVPRVHVIAVRDPLLHADSGRFYFQFYFYLADPANVAGFEIYSCSETDRDRI